MDLLSENELSVAITDILLVRNHSTINHMPTSGCCYSQGFSTKVLTVRSPRKALYAVNDPVLSTMQPLLRSTRRIPPLMSLCDFRSSMYMHMDSVVQYPRRRKRFYRVAATISSPPLTHTISNEQSPPVTLARASISTQTVQYN